MIDEPTRKDRAFLIYLARVYLAQARVFMARNPKPDTFALTLLGWAAKARREAAAVARQREMFA